MHGGLEDLPAGLALGLRLVHGRVGFAQQLFRGLAGLAEGQPYAGRHGELVTVDSHRLAEDVDDPLRHLGRGLLGLRCVHQDRELVPAEAGHRVAPTDDRLQPLAGYGQQVVAILMPEAVVDHLEAVEVAQADRHQPLGLVGGGQGVLDTVV